MEAILATFDQLFKGRFLLFFIPGLVVATIYYGWRWKTQSELDILNYEGDLPLIQWFSDVLTWVAGGIFTILDTIFEQLYIFIVITLLSPFNTTLSEKLDFRLSGNQPETGWARRINEFIRMIFIAIIALFLELIFMLFYWLLTFLPFIGGDYDSIIYFVIKAFFFGFAFYDFSLERYQKNVFQSLGFAFSKPLGMLITGSIFLGIYHIPYAGISLAPVLTVMIATVVYLYYENYLPKSTQDQKE